MSNARIQALNLTANWVGHADNLIVMFFLSPFVVHIRESVEYGIWSLLMADIGVLEHLNSAVCVESLDE